METKRKFGSSEVWDFFLNIDFSPKGTLCCSSLVALYTPVIRKSMNTWIPESMVFPHIKVVLLYDWGCYLVVEFSIVVKCTYLRLLLLNINLPQT
jgi:hypothetical protein